MIVVGIETSCDETSVAIIGDDRKIYSHLVFSQIKEHQDFGGVVPEIAARSHISVLDSMMKKAFDEAGLTIDDVDAIAVTAGPGLIGGVLVGVMYAKGLAASAGKKFIAVNHLEGHALSPMLVDASIEFPFLLLLVSGGHCQIIEAKDIGDYNILGSTLDDAVGEAFDKVARMLGLPNPGGPEVEKRAALGDKNAFQFPHPLIDSNDCNLSFSGLKTAVKRKVDSFIELNDDTINNICASFQRTVAFILAKKLKKGIESSGFESKKIVVAGGVAANQYIKSYLIDTLGGYEISVPPMWLCTDNAAMIAWVGLQKLQLGQVDRLDIEPRSRWSLNEIKKNIVHR